MDGIPRLRNESNGSSTGTGDVCDFVIEEPYETTFNFVDFLPVHTTTLYNTITIMNSKAVNEHSYAKVTVALIAEVIDAIPFFRKPENKLELLEETSISAHLRPDVQVVKKRDGVPFLVVEVNKPLIFSPPRNGKLRFIYGQMFDCMVFKSHMELFPLMMSIKFVGFRTQFLPNLNPI